MRNRGLIDAKNVSLTLFDRKGKIEEFNLKDIVLGAGKKLSVENIRVGRIDYLKIVVDAKDRIKEIYEENNVVELAII